MRFCSYIVKHDTGLAPNPFWGYCTLGLCTPNHQGILLQGGDWILGSTPSARGDKIVFVMQLSERLHFNDYYNDPRFQAKKPKLNGTWRERCGDNMYYKDDEGNWKKHPSSFHCDNGTRKKDMNHPYVFIAEHFFYFGDQAVQIPNEFKELIRRRQGCKCNHNPETVEKFLNWLQHSFNPGIHGKPHDRVLVEQDDCGRHC
ncbi:MAG: hypothetical protein KGY69_16065 [Bacteroidales bacterium]|nr:hypothetical protein [Bacteroidales bacterium]